MFASAILRWTSPDLRLPTGMLMMASSRCASRACMATVCWSGRKPHSITLVSSEPYSWSAAWIPATWSLDPMTTKKITTELRRCTGSARFGIEPHEAPVAEFPKQPSRKDGLGTMCTEHWRSYVKGLREARTAAKAFDEGATVGGSEEADAAWRGTASPSNEGWTSPHVAGRCGSRHT